MEVDLPPPQFARVRTMVSAAITRVLGLARASEAGRATQAAQREEEWRKADAAQARDMIEKLAIERARAGSAQVVLNSIAAQMDALQRTQKEQKQKAAATVRDDARAEAAAAKAVAEPASRAVQSVVAKALAKCVRTCGQGAATSEPQELTHVEQLLLAAAPKMVEALRTAQTAQTRIAAAAVDIMEAAAMLGGPSLPLPLPLTPTPTPTRHPYPYP